MNTGDPAASYRDIPGFPGYRVGDDGSVISCLKKGWRGGPTDLWRTLRPKRHKKSGYMSVNMRDEAGKVRTRTVHTLVLEAFVGPAPAGMVACHDPDPDRSNNRFANLRWDTRRANYDDAARIGTASRGSRRWNARLAEADIPAIRALLAEGKTLEEIASVYRVSPSTIGLISAGKIWSWVK